MNEKKTIADELVAGLTEFADSLERSRPGLIDLPWNMRASDLVRAVEAHHDADPVSFTEELSKYDFTSKPEVSLWLTEPNGKYYRMLAAYTRLFRPKRVCEVGCCYGSSAMALAKFGTKVDTYDIDLSKVCDRRVFADRRISSFELDHPDQCVNIGWKHYDCLFIDIGHHDGRYERVIHERLVSTAWKGVVFWDDIYWDGMRPVWESISNDKAETNWHGSSGFGVVVYKGFPMEAVSERSEETYD